MGKQTKMRSFPSERLISQFKHVAGLEHQMWDKPLPLFAENEISVPCPLVHSTLSFSKRIICHATFPGVLLAEQSGPSISRGTIFADFLRGNLARIIRHNGCSITGAYKP